MGRLHWNFADRSRWSGPWLAVGVIALAGCLHALWWRDTLLAQPQDMVERGGRGTPHRNAAAPVAPAVPAALETVFAEMHYPWMDMLDSLRAATPAGVDLLTLEPDSGAIRRVHIRGVADQTQSVFELVTALHQDPARTSVQLVSRPGTAMRARRPVSIPCCPCRMGRDRPVRCRPACLFAACGMERAVNRRRVLQALFWRGTGHGTGSGRAIWSSLVC